MRFLDDLPHYLRYDVFLTLFGVGVVYFVVTHKNLIEIFFLPEALIVVGVVLFILGLKEMRENYEDQKILQKLVYVREYKKLSKELKSIAPKGKRRLKKH